MPGMPPPSPTSPQTGPPSLPERRRGGWAVAAAVLLLALGSGPFWLWPSEPEHPMPQEAVQAPPVRMPPSLPNALAPRVAHFGGEAASPDVRHIAHWAVHSADHGPRGMVVVDKRNAKVFVFGPDGVLRGAAPALLGSAIGDHTVAGVGDKPLAQVRPEERTTPAGRFVAEMGRNTQGEDVVWVDYDAAVSMHRVRPHVKSERRLERLATQTAADNRISFGCINLPVRFYENVLSPLVRSAGAVVYVLPETRSAATLFGAYEVPTAPAPGAP